MFNLYYKKNSNDKLFSTIEKKSLLKNIQNYIPTYKYFFDMSEKNYNKINLNHKFSISEFINITDDSNSSKNVDFGDLGEYTTKKNSYEIYCMDPSNNKHKKKTFVKYSPLLDPSKYLLGKYSKNKETKLLPSLNHNNKCFEKIQNKNNAAYTDSFFSYLSSILLNNHSFVNGLDFYGSFLGIKPNFEYNITDEIEYLNESEFFHKHKDDLFTTTIDIENKCDSDSRKYKQKIKINKEECSINESIGDIDHLENKFNLIFELTEENLTKHNNSVESTELKELNDDSLCLNFDISSNKTLTSHNKKESESDDTSECSSRTSNTDDSQYDEDSDCETGDSDDTNKSNNDSENDSEEDGSESDDYTDFSELSSMVDIGEYFANIKDFPVQMILLEAMDHTLDICIEKEEFKMSIEEWTSCLFQVILTLLIYQKAFKFTHNDLHTNNVMFKKTDRKFLYYKYDSKYYKVPTYGRIYKIIDFGRAIYTFNGKLICSDSFYKNGDASTQYNFGEFYNENKPMLEPNYSFDLARLACSLYDYFIEDGAELSDLKTPVEKLIFEWCLDDKNRNILYKSNGDERYPDFKLYKMIARTVNKHTPENQLKRDMFKKYVVSKRSINKKTFIFNIDNIPQYYK